MQKYFHNTVVAEEQPQKIISQQQDILNAAELYIAAGFALVPIPYGKKAPARKGWNKHTNTITRPDQVECLRRQNIGLAHAYSGTCAIDIDDYIKADEYLSNNGINLTELLMADDAVQIQSGRENRAKLLYRCPEVLPHFQHCEVGQTIFEFRCGTDNGLTAQDVLPPSIHPDTDEPYIWLGDWQNLPMLPDELHRLWLENKSPTHSSTAPNNMNPQRKDIFSVGNTIFTMGETQDPPLLDHINSTSEVAALYQSESIQRRLLDCLGFKDYEALFRLGRAAVRSIVPPYDKNKSGGLIFSSRGEIMFRDYSDALGKNHFTLPALYASLKAGYLFNLKATKDKESGEVYGKVTPAVWAVRLLVDAGIVKTPDLILPPCPDLRKSVTQYYIGVKLLFQVRWTFKDHKNCPVPMGRNFMSAWTGLSEDQCRDAIKDLLKAGVIHTAGQHGRARLFAPGYKPPQKPKGRTDK